MFVHQLIHSSIDEEFQHQSKNSNSNFDVSCHKLSSKLSNSSPTTISSVDEESLGYNMDSLGGPDGPKKPKHRRNRTTFTTYQVR